MNIVKFYIDAEDVYNKLSDDDKSKYNSIAFRQAIVERDNTVTIEAFCYNDEPEDNILKDIPRRKFSL